MSGPRRWRWPLLLAGAAVLALVQQQLLLRQPPRLLQLRQALASAGPGSLELRFSRPMAAAALARSSRLEPRLQHRWLGQGTILLLTLLEGQRLTEPLQLLLAGRDPRGLPLSPSRWRWDPRPRVVAVVPVRGGEQLQLQERDGRWRALAPVWPSIPMLLPLGDGSGVVAASQRPDGLLQLWRIPLRQRNPENTASPDPGLRVGKARPLQEQAVNVAHFSSNRRGDLLLQTSGLRPGSGATVLMVASGEQRRLALRAGGPIQLTPEGGAALVPLADGLQLRSLPGPAAGQEQARDQTLPGSRDLSSFCPRSGRAVLLRHWPDFRRSLELVEPGQAPRQLWLGGEAVLASACSGGGQRVWALLLDGIERPLLSVAVISREGLQLRRQPLPGWEAEPGAPLQWDPASGQLLTVLRPLAQAGRAPAPARMVLIDGETLSLRPFGPPVSQARWLPAG